jgi:putative sugar O-methyltransferase
MTIPSLEQTQDSLLFEEIDLLNNSQKMIQFLEENYQKESLLSSFFMSYEKCGSLQNVIYLHQNGYFQIPDSFTETILEYAAQYDQLEIIRYLHQNGFNINSDASKRGLLRAIVTDRTEIIRYFHQQGFSFSTDFVDELVLACGSNESLGCIEYFLHNGLFELQEDKNLCVAENAMRKAGMKDRVGVIKYFHQKGFSFSEDFIEQLVELCGAHKSAYCFKYLHENGLIGAIINWSFFLNEYFQSTLQQSKEITGKTSAALKKASCILYNGKDTLDNVFKGLNLKDIEKCYYLAVSNNYINIYHYLRKNFDFLMLNQKIEREAFELALCNNRQEIVSFYLENNPLFLKRRRFLKEMVKSVAIFCNIEVLALFLTYCNGLKINLKQRLLYHAAMNNRHDLILYLHEVEATPLRIFLKVNTEGLQEGPVRRLLSDRRCLNELKKDLTCINAMHATIKNDEKIFHPSLFWEFFNDINLTLLKESGFKNFKRNVNQNYFNFVPSILIDSFVISIVFLKLVGFRRSKSKYHLVDPDVINSDGELKEEYRRVFQKSRKLKLFLYRVVVGGLWNYVKRHDPEGLLEKLEEPRIGNPIELRDDQRLISQDLANSVQEYYFIQPYIKKIQKNPFNIVEIGAGYGRSGYVLVNTLNCKYIVFDIPPALYIAQKYLTTLFPDKKIFSFRHINSFDEIKEELEKSDIAFFTINQIKFFPENFCDFSINISSLHEMTIEQREKISEYMAKITKEFIYIKQYKNYKNPLDGIVVKEKDYKFSAPWRLVKRRTTPTNIRFFEMIFHKRLS